MKSGWSIPIEKLAEKAKLDIELVARRAAFQVFNNVLNLSPVDTGRFRANWNVSQGEPDRTTSEATQDGRGEAEVKKALTFQVGGTIYMTNSLPYAKRLEDGWSKQAPTGMVRKTVVQYARFVRKAIR